MGFRGGRDSSCCLVQPSDLERSKIRPEWRPRLVWGHLGELVAEPEFKPRPPIPHPTSLLFPIDSTAHKMVIESLTFPGICLEDRDGREVGISAMRGW